MTDQSIETELSRKAIGDAAFPKVVVDRDFLQRVLAHIQKPHVCPHCQEREAFGLTEHLQAPSRANAMAAAFAVNAAHGRGVL